MKKLNFLGVTFLILLAIVGCRKKVEVNFISNECQLDSEGTAVTVLLQSNGAWSVTSVSEWINVSPMSGDGDTELTISADKNPLEDIRSGEVKVSSKDNETTLQVRQDFYIHEEYHLAVTPTTIVAQGAGDTLVFNIECNMPWHLEDVPAWITPSKVEGEGDALVTLYVQPNNIGDVNARTADIIVVADFLSLSVTIVQGNGVVENLFVTPSSLSFDYADTEAQILTVVTNQEWRIESKPEWVTVDVDHAAQGLEILVNVEENTELVGRSGPMVIVSGDNQVTATIVQRPAPDPHYLVVSPLSVDFPTEGGEQVITVDCDAEWTVSGFASWFSISTESGSGQGTFSIIAEKNDFIGERTARVTVSSLGINQSISLHQASGTIQPYLTATPLEIEVPVEGGVYTIDVTSNVEWSVRAPMWVEVPVPNGSGDGVVIINVPENTTSLMRTGVLSIRCSNDLSVAVTISQQANGAILPVLEVDIENISFQPLGGTKTVQVTSNQHWTLEGEDWMEFSPAEGDNDGSFDLTVERNPATTPRRGMVIITGDLGSVLKIKVSQN